MPWSEPIARRAAWVMIAAAVIAFLALARDFVMPLALAMLLAFMLTPIVRWLNNRIHSHVASVILASLIGGSVLLVVGFAAVHQLFDLADQLPKYRHTVSEKLIALRGNGDGTIARATRAMQQIEQDVTAATTNPSLDSRVGVGPIEVVTANRPQFFRDTIESLSPLLEPAAQFAIVLVLTVLLLFYREDLRDRVVVLAGTQQIGVTAQALEDASQRISRYLLLLSAVNTFFGVCISIGLMFIGIPNALLMGLMAGLLRFIPVAGAWLGALPPVLLAIAVIDSWHGVFFVAGLFLLMEALTNFVIEPWLYGHHTGISGVAVVLAIVFWSWIWGPIGLLLAVPITVCVTVFGKYVEPLRVFYILLSDEPTLAGERRLYHRVVTGDLSAAEQIADDAVKEMGMTRVCDELFLPVLLSARNENERGMLADDRLEMVYDTLSSLADAPEGPVSAIPGIACVPLDDNERVAAILSASAMGKSLEEPVEVLSSHLLADVSKYVDEHPATSMVLVGGSPSATVRGRLLAKAILRRCSDCRVILVDYSGLSPKGGSRELAGLQIVHKVSDALERVEQTVREKESVKPVVVDTPAAAVATA